MGIDEISSILGKLMEGQAALQRDIDIGRRESREDNQDLRAEMAGVKQVVYDLQAKGCARGDQDRVRLEKLEGGFRTMVGWLIGGNVAGLGAIEAVKKYFGG